jgi:hypothetical protein
VETGPIATARADLQSPNVHSVCPCRPQFSRAAKCPFDPRRRLEPSWHRSCGIECGKTEPKTSEVGQPQRAIAQTMPIGTTIATSVSDMAERVGTGIAVTLRVGS